MANKDKNSSNSLRWRFDVNTFRLLGRDLITDRITAVFELVKNCYDANSTNVTVDLIDIISPSSNRKIIISDNGIGMSFEDIRDKWMVVGTNSKRKELYSPEPFNRKYVGEKGIGRFAVDKLGERLQIITKQKGEKQTLNVSILWDIYEKKANQFPSENQLSLFTEIDNEYYYDTSLGRDTHGTKLVISNISEIWTIADIDRLYKELSKLISPFYPVDPPFNINLNSNESKDFQNKVVKSEPIRFYSHHGSIDFDLKTGKQQTLRFNKKTGLIETEWIDIKPFGPVKMNLFYFNESGKRRYNAAHKNDNHRIDGVKIYRDGVVTTPFAELEHSSEKKRDILGIDKRRWSSTFDRVGTKEVLGLVDITKQFNPKIIDATNRQDFIDVIEYRLLKDFIIDQIKVFEQIKHYERQKIRTAAEIELSEAGKRAKTLENELKQIETNVTQISPEIKDTIEQIRVQTSALHGTISKSIQEQKRYQQDVERKEKILYSIVSMQEYASLISHAVRTSIAKVKHLGEFFKLNFPNPKFDSYFKNYAVLIHEEMNTLLKVTDFMLSYASSDKNYEDFNIKTLITDLLTNSYEAIFINEGIELIIQINDDFILNTNKQAFQDIFQNLVSNSIKALKNTSNKKIKCSGFLDQDNFIIYFSDNGSGIILGDEKWIFGLYNTRTAEHGGAGIGLYIVEKQITALNGKIEIVESEFKPTGATFKITLPFNKILNE